MEKALLRFIEKYGVGNNDNYIHPTAIVGNDVLLGHSNFIAPNVVISGRVDIGNWNYFGTASTIGGLTRQRFHSATSPFKPSVDGKIIIGNNNLIFERVTVHSPMLKETKIHDFTSIGAQSHISHDSEIRDYSILAPGVTIGGYVILGVSSNIGLNVSIHPRTCIGAYALCGVGSVVVRHVSPGMVVAGVPAKYIKPNLKGMQRAELSKEIIKNFVHYLSDDEDMHTVELTQIIQQYTDDCLKWKRNKYL